MASSSEQRVAHPILRNNALLPTYDVSASSSSSSSSVTYVTAPFTTTVSNGSTTSFLVSKDADRARRLSYHASDRGRASAARAPAAPAGVGSIANMHTHRAVLTSRVKTRDRDRDRYKGKEKDKDKDKDRLRRIPAVSMSGIDQTQHRHSHHVKFEPVNGTAGTAVVDSRASKGDLRRTKSCNTNKYSKNYPKLRAPPHHSHRHHSPPPSASFSAGVSTTTVLDHLNPTLTTPLPSPSPRRIQSHPLPSNTHQRTSRRWAQDRHLERQRQRQRQQQGQQGAVTMPSQHHPSELDHVLRVLQSCSSAVCHFFRHTIPAFVLSIPRFAISVLQTLLNKPSPSPSSSVPTHTISAPTATPTPNPIPASTHVPVPTTASTANHSINIHNHLPDSPNHHYSPLLRLSH